MSDEKLNFLDAEEPATPAPEPSAPVIEAEKPAAPEPEPQGDTRARDPETGRFVPISALLDERDKRQATTRELEEARKQLAHYQQPREPEQVPTEPADILQRALEQQRQEAFNERLWTSQMMAEQAFTKEVVTEAQQAFLAAASQNPVLAQQLRAEIHPYDFVVKWHEKHKLMSEIGEDPKAYRQRVREEVLQELRGQGVQPTQSSQQPPPSVVGRPAAARAGTVPTGPGNAFDNLFRG